MPRSGKSLLLLGIILILASKDSALELPYEVLESIVELSDLDDFKDLNKVNVSDERGPTRPIYRLDLDPNYVAYYEIDTGNDYVVLSAGADTGDFREVQSGPDPRPTDVLIKQAQNHGQQCERFYRLSPMGLTICKNVNGTVVAASYNWTADVAEIDDWRRLDHMVKASLNTFQGLWRKRAEERRTILDWATTDVFGRPKKETDEEALSPGAVVKVALGERFRSVNVYITSIGNRAFRPKSNSQRQKWQQKLCKVLVDVCQGGSSKVNPLAVKKTPNHLSYLKLEIHGSLRFVQKVLEGREIGFVVRIKRQQQRAIIKHYAINLHPKRFGRSPPPGSGNRKILGADYNMPDYDQHKCCGNCLSGCSPVAWAQVFGYYDRCASWYNSIFSPRIYGDSNKIAPKTMTDEVKPFVEDIRKRVKTYCRNGEGLTKSSKMHLIEPWFRARQGAKARAVTYLRRRWFLDLFSFNSRIYKRSASSIISKGKWWLNKGYPVVFGFLTERKNGHAAVATKYRVRSRRYRHCVKLWFITIRCTWKTANDCEFFLHYGWGPNHNRWLQLDSTILSAHVAYITK